MIMPADPKVGNAYRPENIAGLVFEEVTVKEVGKTVAGPRGPIHGAIVTRELHDDGSFEEKVFAPGYGEFFTRERWRRRGACSRRTDGLASRRRACRARDDLDRCGPGLRGARIRGSRSCEPDERRLDDVSPVR